jgi:hypothetical protein
LLCAALPEWTDRLADAAGFPPGSSVARIEFLDSLYGAGLLEQREDDVEGEVVTAFWLPASRRAEVAAVLRETLAVAAMLTRVAAC